MFPRVFISILFFHLFMNTSIFNFFHFFWDKYFQLVVPIHIFLAKIRSLSFYNSRRLTLAIWRILGVSVNGRLQAICGEGFNDRIDDILSFYWKHTRATNLLLSWPLLLQWWYLSLASSPIEIGIMKLELNL